MSTAIGRALSEVNRTPSYDPNYGHSVAITWQGTEDACKSKAADLLSARLRFSGPRAIGGGAWEIQANIPQADDTTTEASQDSWELDFIEEQIEIWRHPNVEAYLHAQDDRGALIKKQIKDAAQKADDNPDELVTPDFASDATAFAIYTELIKGGGATSYRRPIIRVRRTFSPNYSDRYQISAKPNGYATSTLVSTFGVPSVIESQLPDDPDVEDASLYAWAWIDSGQSIMAVPSIGRVEETRQWTFAKVALLLFNVT